MIWIITWVGRPLILSELQANIGERPRRHKAYGRTMSENLSRSERRPLAGGQYIVC